MKRWLKKNIYVLCSACLGYTIIYYISGFSYVLLENRNFHPRTKADWSRQKGVRFIPPHLRFPKTVRQSYIWDVPFPNLKNPYHQ